MRIYNEIITIFNENTGLWETISEDSYDHTGFVMLAQGSLPNNATAISAQDTIADTIKTTAGYFSGNDGTLDGNAIHTQSLSDSNDSYYINVTQTTASMIEAVQFSVAFGHINGSGSNQYGDTNNDPGNLIGETQAIYKQWTSFLLEETEASGGFKISQGGAAVSASLSSGVRDEYIYILLGRRERFKDRINKKAWTLTLSGSNSTGSGTTLVITDDSAIQAATSTPAGPRHNIVSGALGVTYESTPTRHFGWFYPERGVMIFSGAELSASIPGGPIYQDPIRENVNHITASHGSAIISCSFEASPINIGASLAVGDMLQITSASGTTSATIQTVQIQSMSAHNITLSHPYNPSKAVGGTDGGTFADQEFYITASLGVTPTNITASWSTDASIRDSASGFAPNLDAKNNSYNGIRLVNCMRNFAEGTTFQVRSEEDASQENFFCRIKANQYNFSANPTFTSGSYNKIRNKDMHGNPSTFITGIGLYNSAGQLLAIASLSKPLRKHFASEATIKVKLTY